MLDVWMVILHTYDQKSCFWKFANVKKTGESKTFFPIWFKFWTKQRSRKVNLLLKLNVFSRNPLLEKNFHHIQSKRSTKTRSTVIRLSFRFVPMNTFTCYKNLLIFHKTLFFGYQLCLVCILFQKFPQT